MTSSGCARAEGCDEGVYAQWIAQGVPVLEDDDEDEDEDMSSES